MRTSFLITCYLVFVAGIVSGQTRRQRLQLNLQTGYERQDLNWSIAGNSAGQNPNVYSELKWRDVGGQSVNADLQWNVWNRVVLTAGYSRMFIRSGTVTDNDYNGDNRTSPAYDMTFDADKGNTQAYDFGAGYTIINSNNFKLTPFVGYGVNKQSLHLLDNTGSFVDLNSTYDTDWKGAFIRAIAELKLVSRLKFTGNITYNQVTYNAKANWNLIPSFQHPVSYRHNAKGYGIDGNASLSYSLTKIVAVNIGAGYFTFSTGKGIDELFLTSGGSSKTQLNGVDRKGYRLFGGLTFNY